MKLKLIRKFKGDTYTVGDLYVDGKIFCNTIEDKVRPLPSTCPKTPRGLNCQCKEKVYAQTAIPAGTYRITLDYSNRFKRILPRLHDVPHFIGILIHNGNTDADSSGCILVGVNSAKGKVLQSVATMQNLMKLLEGQKEIIIEIL